MSTHRYHHSSSRCKTDSFVASLPSLMLNDVESVPSWLIDMNECSLVDFMLRLLSPMMERLHWNVVDVPSV